MAIDYYQILGVNSSASEAEIKKAYRRLAHQHHPDKAGGSDERFKEINEAYQVLSDPRKRAEYDQFGSVGSRGRTGGFGAEDFGGFGGFRARSGGFDFGGFGTGGIGSIFEDLFESAFSQVQVELPISIPQAVLGDTIRFKTQFGDELELKIPAGVQTGASFNFRGKGQQTRRGRGDLVVTIKIEIPKRLNRQERELYEELKRISR